MKKFLFALAAVLRWIFEPLHELATRRFAAHVVPPTKAIVALAPASFTNGATGTGAIDRMGFDFMTLDLLAATADVVSNKFSVCKLSHSDTTDSTNYSDVTKFVAGGVGGFTLASANTSAAYVVKMNVDLRAMKRYVKLTVSPRTTQVLSAVANLRKGEVDPVSATDVGANTLVEG